MRYIKSRLGAMKKRFLSARMMGLWNELNEETTAVDIEDKLQRKLGKHGY